MRVLGQSEETDELHKTHTVFFESNIVDETPKAFKIKVRNLRGGWSTGWVPKSKTLMLTMSNPLDADNPITKFFAPKFFTQ